MNTELMFSTGKDDWATPLEVFNPLHDEFAFTLDAAANAGNAKCDFFYGPGSALRVDALLEPWPLSDRIWVNPPYSRGLQARFVAHAATTAINGGLVVMLLPARTDTKSFHQHIWDRERHKSRPWVREVRFVKGRIRFVGAPAAAPFPSMVVVFDR